MKNPIVQCNLFHTPTEDELMKQIESLPAGTRSTVMIYVMMAVNMCGASVDKAIAKELTTQSVIG